MSPTIIYITVVLYSVFGTSEQPGPVQFRVDPRSIVTIRPAECNSKAAETFRKQCSALRTRDGKVEIVIGSPDEIEADIRKQLTEWKP